MQDKQTTQYQLIPKSKCRTLQHYWNFPSQNYDTSGQNLGPTLKTQLFVLNEICIATHLPDYCGKDNLAKFYQDQDRKKYQIGNACLRVERKVYFYRCSWTTFKWLEETRKSSDVEEIDETGWPWRTEIISWPRVLGMHSTWMQIERKYFWRAQKIFESRISARATEKLPVWDRSHAKTIAWSYDMEEHAKKCVEKYCELANKKSEQLYKVSTPCLDDHHFKKEELESVGELSNVCSQIVSKCLYQARIGRLDLLWSVNKLEDSKSTSGEYLLWSPTSWMCKKQTLVSHNLKLFL